MKPKLTWIIACIFYTFAINQIQSQPYSVCSELSEHVFQEEKGLCEIYDDFDEDLQIGPSASSSGLGTSYFQNMDIYITGLFIINSYIWFDNCRIQMAPGALIYITSSGRLVFWKTDVFACETRWLGMSLASGGTLLSYYSRFEDADYLLRVNKIKGPNLVLYHNVFNRNYIGILARPITPSDVPILNFYSFAGNTFDCTAALLDKWDSNLPDVDVSFAGIQTENTIGTVGQFNASNRFQNMQHGIYAVKSNLAVNRCEFYDMALTSALGSDGSGIYALNSNIQITDNPNNPGATTGSEFLRNGRAGILAESSSLVVRDCDFDEISNAYGIMSSNNKSSEHINISWNRFEQSNGTCVFLDRSAASGVENNTNAIDHNTFDLDNSESGAACIRVRALNASTDRMQILSNLPIELSGDGNAAGINIRSNSDYFSIDGNEINMAVGAKVGIEMGSLQNVFGSFIGFNTVTGESYTNLDKGFHIINTPNLTMCDNTTSDLGYGQHLVGHNDKMVFSLNSMTSHKIGLWVEESGKLPGVMGEQRKRSNYWFTPFNQNAAKNESDPVYSLFYIDDPNDITKLPNQLNPSSGWFFPDEGDPETCLELQPYNPGLTTFDTIVIDDTYPSPSPSDAAIWELNRRLMYKMKRYPVLQSRAGSYYDDDSTMTYGLLAETDYRYYLAMQIDTIKMEILDSLRSKIDSLFAEIALVDTVLAPPNDTITNDTSKNDTKIALIARIAASDSLRHVLLDQVRTQQIADLTDVLNYNDTITVVEDWEINQKAVNHFMLMVARGDTLDSEDLDSLRVIAGTCLEDGGFATLEASAFLPICEWPDYEDVVCERSSKRPQNDFFPDESFVRIYPNPSATTLHFEFTGEFTGQILILDALGSIVKEEWVKDARLFSTRVTELSGVYFYQLIDEQNRIVDKGKIIVSR